MNEEKAAQLFVTKSLTGLYWLKYSQLRPDPKRRHIDPTTFFKIESFYLREKSDCHYLCIHLHKLLLSSVTVKLYGLDISKKTGYERTTPPLDGNSIKEFAAML